MARLKYSTIDPQMELNAFTKTWKTGNIEPTACSFTSTRCFAGVRQIHLCEDHRADRLVAAVARSTRWPDTLLGFLVNICIVMYVFNEKS